MEIFPHIFCLSCGKIHPTESFQCCYLLVFLRAIKCIKMWYNHCSFGESVLSFYSGPQAEQHIFITDPSPKSLPPIYLLRSLLALLRVPSLWCAVSRLQISGFFLCIMYSPSSYIYLYYIWERQIFVKIILSILLKKLLIPRQQTRSGGGIWMILEEIARSFKCQF